LKDANEISQVGKTVSHTISAPISKTLFEQGGHCSSIFIRIAGLSGASAVMVRLKSNTCPIIFLKITNLILILDWCLWCTQKVGERSRETQSRSKSDIRDSKQISFLAFNNTFGRATIQTSVSQWLTPSGRNDFIFGHLLLYGTYQ
jgi:hypothetical protein